VKGGGHGCYRNLVLAPASVQELVDLTMQAFELADRYRNPVVVLADGSVGQMMEPVSFPEPWPVPAAPAWAVTGTGVTRGNLVNSIHLEPDVLEAHVRALEAKYREAERSETRWETWKVDDADVVLVGYGIVARVLRAGAEAARRRGLRVGLLRPITLFPFPKQSFEAVSRHCKKFLDIELSTGQMIEDVRLSVARDAEVSFYGRPPGAGSLPTPEELFEQIKKQY